MLIRGLMFIAEEIRGQAETELYSEDGVLEEMKESYTLLESGAIGEEEFDRREQAFLGRLQAIEARRQGARARPARRAPRTARRVRTRRSTPAAPNEAAGVKSR